MKSMLRFLIIFCLVFGFRSALASTLSAGDIAIITMNADGADDFVFILLADISGTTEIHFTDNGWDSGTSNWGTASEGTVTWTFTGALSLGTEVSINNPQTGTATASHGSAVVSGSFNISGGGDQLIAYQGTVASPTFLYAFNHRANCWSPCSVGTSSLNSNLPPGLTEGVSALSTDPTHEDNWQYNCAVITGTRSELLAAIANVNNYNRNSSSTYGAPGCNILLPVELSYFEASQQIDNTIKLDWRTASEINNMGFEIERRANDSDWQKIGFVRGSDQNFEPQDYSFIDFEPFAENYYRLKQIDEDGSFEYSKILHIDIASHIGQKEMIIYPNPAKDELTIAQAKGLIRLYNLLGEPLKQYTIQESSIIIDISHLETGTYYLELIHENGKRNTRHFFKY